MPARRGDRPRASGRGSRLALVAAFKPAYLIHGDDHGRIAERRARLRMLAEAESGVNGVELFEGETSTPDAVAAALRAMTLAVGRRFIVVDGVERWKEKDLEGVIAVLGEIPPETTVAFFAREEGRAKAPKPLHDAVRKAGGDISAEDSVKPWELPKWVTARARELGLELGPEAARALVRNVGERQQRLLRELEKLALGFEPGARLEASDLEELTASSAERKSWTLADALVGGDPEAATRAYLALRAQGERVPGLLYWISQRVRLAHEVAAALDSGEPAAQVKRRLRMPSRAADRLIADARQSGAERLRQATCEIADLELASRGGSSGGASEDTSVLLAIMRIAA
jgi:DNA polymerase III subunit delta